MGAVKERTQNEIVDYIRTHAKDGKLTKSMLDIANKIGYSNATVHRALKALQEKGLIEITEADVPTKPNTIIFKGEPEVVDHLLAEGAELTEQLAHLSQSISVYMQSVEKALRKQDQQTGIAPEQILLVTDIPNTDMQMVTIRKEVLQ